MQQLEQSLKSGLRVEEGAEGAAEDRLQQKVRKIYEFFAAQTAKLMTRMGQTNSQTDRQADKRTDGRMDRQRRL